MQCEEFLPEHFSQLLIAAGVKKDAIVRNGELPCQTTERSFPALDFVLARLATKHRHRFIALAMTISSPASTWRSSSERLVFA
jgi:hypothetical protein